MSSTGREPEFHSPTARWVRSPFIVPAAFLALVAIFLLDPVGFVNPISTPAPTPAWAVDPTPVRQPTLEPETDIGVYRFRCNECHRLMHSPPETDRPLTQHRDIRLQHGINNRCFNCHHPLDRNAFVDYRGDAIPYDEPQFLCAKCHGPVYRDWTHGVHGRTNGFWNEEMGPREFRKCIECHDPHAPAFQPMAPAPGPRTLRMGEPRGDASHDGEKRNPLLIYRQTATHPGESDATPTSPGGGHEK